MTATQFIAAGCTAALTVLLPLAGMLALGKARRSWKAFGVGAATFFLFALVLESLVSQAVVLTPLGDVLRGNLWLYALYGGLAAGLFEETGRLAAFRWVLRKEDRPVTALSYGLGHGGMEAVLITGLGMVSNIVLGAMVNAGTALPGELAPLVQTLADAPAATFLWAGLERASAMGIHVANSVLVFTAVKKRRWGLYVLAILTHTLVNALAVLCNAVLPIYATELIVLLCAALVGALAWRVYRAQWARA